MDKLKNVDIGIIVECEGGYVAVGNYGSAEVFDKDGKSMHKFSSKGGGDSTAVHFNNFLQAVHSRKREDLWADIEEGHLSSALCHTSNISYRLGQQSDPAVIEAAIKDNPLMMEAWGRMKEHLVKNNVDISKEKLTLGLPLKMDGKAEKFIDNEQASALLTRKYREPFVVPATVS
jgi:hypothetical protein